MTGTQPQILTVRSVFEDERYIIPIYQRAFAWERSEIETLLRDVRDYRILHGPDKAYYLGSLVVHTGRSPDPGERLHEVVDGQQRLTTLYLLLARAASLGVAGVPSLKDVLSFEGREHSTTDLARALNPSATPETFEDDGISVGIETIDAALWQPSGTTDRSAATMRFERADLEYLLDCVTLVRSELPPHTDLNHYFEVMNSRGEQLEKHEIVKANLLSLLDASDHTAFATVWDACSQLERHVQANLEVKARDKVFGQRTWNEFLPRDEKDLFNRLRPDDDVGDDVATGIADILAAPGAGPSTTRGTQDAADRYGLIIDFPNFLLQALKVHKGDEISWEASATPGDHVSLDDKRLVEEFSRKLRNRSDVLAFTFTLLRLRYLFDRYVIKPDEREGSNADSKWVLHLVHRTASDKLSPANTFGVVSSRDDEPPDSADGPHDAIVMVQAMFQVSEPRRSYKNLLHATLRFLHQQDAADVAAQLYLAELNRIAKNRFESLSLDDASLDAGTRVPLYVFNYLDYLLWLRFTQHPTEKPAGVDPASYRFRYRTSVEHFFPQWASDEDRRLSQETVDRFGNLCLMSGSDNSKRSNMYPLAKTAQFRTREHEQSLKYQCIAAIIRANQRSGKPEDQVWYEQDFGPHAADMIKLLRAGPAPTLPAG